jgi:galactokinase
VTDALRHAIIGMPNGEILTARLQQFTEECNSIIPAVLRLLARGDVAATGPLVDRSHEMAIHILRNQLPETVHLAQSARATGAVAASAFGAGFGGSVWALVPTVDAALFLESWREGYRARFPERANRAEFFLTRPGPGAMEIN